MYLHAQSMVFGVRFDDVRVWENKREEIIV